MFDNSVTRLRWRWTELGVWYSNDADASLMRRRGLRCRCGRLVDTGKQLILAVLKRATEICIQNVSTGSSR